MFTYFMVVFLFYYSPVRFSCWFRHSRCCLYIYYLTTNFLDIGCEYRWDAYINVDLIGLEPPKRYSYLNRYIRTSKLSSSSDEASCFFNSFLNISMKIKPQIWGNNTFVIPHMNHIINAIIKIIIHIWYCIYPGAIDL